MKSSVAEIPTIIGTAMGGGFYAGRILVEGQAYALIVAPKSEGEVDDIEWNSSYSNVEGAGSYNDGLGNTKAMAEAGSELAKKALACRAAGNDDWYLPSQDELEILYRNLKPTGDENSLYARSGVNASSLTPTHPYSKESPAQTQAELFQEGGSEAFTDEWYWSSTQHAANSDCAWDQGFSDGYQDYTSKSDELRARFVRRLPI